MVRQQGRSVGFELFSVEGCLSASGVEFGFLTLGINWEPGESLATCLV
jgi:hypothetical protein